MAGPSVGPQASCTYASEVRGIGFASYWRPQPVEQERKARVRRDIDKALFGGNFMVQILRTHESACREIHCNRRHENDCSRVSCIGHTLARVQGRVTPGKSAYRTSPVLGLTSPVSALISTGPQIHL